MSQQSCSCSGCLLWLLVVALCFAMWGCAAPVEERTLDNGNIFGNVFDAEINGTRCIGWASSYASGLQCDFAGDSLP